MRIGHIFADRRASVCRQAADPRGIWEAKMSSLGRDSCATRFYGIGSVAFPALTSPRNLGSPFAVWQPNREPMPAFQNDAIMTGVPRRQRMEPSSAPSATRRIGVAPPPDREQAFAKAKRHSTRVRLLRLVILIGGLGVGRGDVRGRHFRPFLDKTGIIDVLPPFRWREQRSSWTGRSLLDFAAMGSPIS